MAFSLWLAFFGASVLLAIAPGPDNLFVLMQSAVFGVRAGMIVVLGLATGLLLQTLAAALGLLQWWRRFRHSSGPSSV